MAGPKYRLLSQQAATLTFAYYGSKSYFLHAQQQGGLTSCDCWGPVNTLQAVNQLCKTNRYTELTLSGSNPGTFLCRTHPLIPTSGFMAVEPETFKVDMDWTQWDSSILERMSVVNLKTLKLPISQHSDYIRLGRALTKMPRLVRLAITDIPNSQKFMNQLGHIGEGILNCASTLRELNIELTSPQSLSRIQPEEDGFIFGKLFPCELMENLSVSRERSRLDTGSVVEAPLRLTKLRFKNLSLPLYSFGGIFDATTIKHIDLPCSMVDSEVWKVLETYAQLDTLTEIDHDMISAEFLRFLGRQPSLKEFTFVLRRDWYWRMYVSLVCEGCDMNNFTPVGAGARHPSLEDFLSSLQHMKMLKHLVLPWDLYPMTSRILTFIAATLTGLEHLELGFDYEDRVSVTTCLLNLKAIGS